MTNVLNLRALNFNAISFVSLQKLAQLVILIDTPLMDYIKITLISIPNVADKFKTRNVINISILSIK